MVVPQFVYLCMVAVLEPCIRVVLRPRYLAGAMSFVSTPNADLITDAWRYPEGCRRLRRHPLGTALHSPVGYSHLTSKLTFFYYNW